MASLKGLDGSLQTQALRNHSTFLKAALLVTHKRAAELQNISPATESEWCSEQMERACQVLASYGLKIVLATEKTYSPRRIANLIDLSIEQLQREREEIETTIPGVLDEAR